ncbi:MAG: septal ring lytic transglycosylase RlpA family protein [Candidatus Omnitrophica bacterium]|nr:septal ring lytic transglycosylase RlpA family protein [Candidatus Omnitrophota bacterium]
MRSLRILIIITLAAGGLFINWNSTDATGSLTVGLASWYSEESPGINRTTANMEIFDDTAMTCAMWDIPFGTMLEVRNLENGRSVVVRVNDRGPARRFHRRGRVIDLTREAFRRIAHPDKGLVTVTVRVIDPA